MKSITKKLLVVITIVGAMTVGSGAMGVSAAHPNQLVRGDSGGSIPVAVAGVTNLDTVHQSRHGIGLLP